MPLKDPIKRKQYHDNYNRKRYQKHKKEYKLRVKIRTAKIKKWYVNLKSSLSCIKCGEDDSRCLDFHHRDKTKKIKAVSQMVRDRAGKETILAEIAKCDVLCANCHRKITISTR